MSLEPETLLRILLPASEIPDRSEVSKRTGDAVFTLRHCLTVYPEDSLEKAGAAAMTLDGYFLLGERGSVNQVKSDTLLHWRITAEDFDEELQEALAGTPQ